MPKPLLLIVLLGCAGLLRAAPHFQAGAHLVDISPTGFPVRVNGMFTERSAEKVVDRLYAKALALDDGATRLVICVVDSCMIPRDLIDRAKQEANKATGIPVDRMLVSATHTHSAPSAMGCLGSRVDPAYAAYLPSRIASAVTAAVHRLEPARIGWAQQDLWEHTFNRRWIRRPDKLLSDPFGEKNVRANMHPGHDSPDAIGPSGPVDPQLSLIAVQRMDGKPLAILANFSQHYYGSPLLSSDYFGRFADHLSRLIGADASFVGMMSQGTSGDLASMDYGGPRREVGYDTYAREIAERVSAMLRTIQWKESAPLRMAEQTLALAYRVPEEKRLLWARATTEKLKGALPKTHPEVYALEAIHLHEMARTELKLQALGIGDMGIAALPNEVYAITGLKLKQQSPFAATFNVTLANGAEGYIPPPEQHKLGGYTTWPARTAGLETNAEPRIVETLLTLLENVAGPPRRKLEAPSGEYAQHILRDKPAAYWRFEDIKTPVVADSAGAAHATYEDGVAVFLPGSDQRRGHLPAQLTATNAFSGYAINRAAHFAGGRVRAEMPLGDTYSVELWLWNGLPADARAVAGYAFSRGPDRDKAARGEHLGIGGTYRAGLAGKLILFNGNERNEVLLGRTTLALRAWHHVVLVRDGNQVRVYLDGRAEPEIEGNFEHTVPADEKTIFVGGRSDNQFNFEGKIDEVALYTRVLSPAEIAAHYKSSGLTAPVGAVISRKPDTEPLSPLESMRKIHVSPGFGFELVAAEPLTMDPVAIDWSADGRLWVVEMADYPLGMDGKGKPGGRIRVLEDVDGDGRYDKQQLFADGLSFPTGLLTWRDGVLVTAAPELVFLRDTDGDGKADSRETLISGLMEGNQQLRANGLRWGLDGWVYCAAGGHHRGHGAGNKIRSTRAKKEITVGALDFRFNPDTGEVEPESGPSQFGRNRDDWGHWFGTQNSRPLWHYVLADRYLRRNAHVAAPDPTKQIVVPLNPKVWPVSLPEKRYHSFDNAGHFTSACGGMIYRDDLLFGAGPEMHAFTCEPFHNLVQRNVIVPDGVSYAAQRAPGEERADFFASEDRWCRPVMTRTGPDGALWVVDMYRYMIEHPDWLPANGREELLPHYRLGEERGRIYRVFSIAKPPRKVKRMDSLSTTALVAALDSPNEWERDKAHMMLLWRADKAAVNTLETLAASSSPLARVHALSVLDGSGALSTPLLAHAFEDPHPGVRENAVRLSEKHPATMAAAIRLEDDPDPKVRLQLALTLGEWSDPRAGEALGRLAVANHEDPFFVAAVMSSAVPHAQMLINAAVRAGGNPLTKLSEPLMNLALGLNDRSALAALLGPSLTSTNGRFSTAQMAAFTQFLETLARRRTTLAALAVGEDALAKQLTAAQSVFAAAKQIAASAGEAVAARAAAANLLARGAVERTETLSMLSGWLEAQHPGELQRAAVDALSLTADISIPARLLEGWNSYSPGIRTAALEKLFSREPWTFALLQHAETNSLLQLDASRRNQLREHSSPRVRALAAKVFNTAEQSSRASVFREFEPSLKLAGDATRGKTVYDRLCITCHRRNELGNEVGPDLRSVSGHPLEKLLANIIDPSADVQPGFHAYHCRLTDGTELYGLVAAETGNSVTFKLADASTHAVLRSEIAELRGASVSLMPEGLETGISHQEMADLIHYLRSNESSAGDAQLVTGDLRVGAAAAPLPCDDSMPLAGYLESRFTKEQEGELRAVAVVVEKPGSGKAAMVACDVLWLTRQVVDAAAEEIARTTGISASHLLVNATHTHHAPGTAPAHAFGSSEKFAQEVRRAIVASVQAANARLTNASLYFKLWEERTVGACSRLLLRDGNISWLNPMAEARDLVQPTAPFDPELPVFDFRGADGRTLALIYNHSTHTLGTRSGRDVRSPSFYGLAAQELERELGATVSFLEGASGSTHNVRNVPVPVAIERMKNAVQAARSAAERRPVGRVTAIKRPFTYRVRTFDEGEEAGKVERYAHAHAASSAKRISEIFASARKELQARRGEERTTWLQVMVIGDIAIAGVPAEYFTGLGLEIKSRSPFADTYIAELANDWIGYLPDRNGHELGGYQTWTGLHSYAEAGTGERVADEIISMLQEIKQQGKPFQQQRPVGR